MIRFLLNLYIVTNFANASVESISKEKIIHLEEEHKTCNQTKNFYLLEIKLANIKNELVKLSEISVISYQLKINGKILQKIKHLQNNNWQKRRFIIARDDIEYKDNTGYEYESFILDTDIINKDARNKVELRVLSGLSNMDFVGSPKVNNVLEYNRTINISSKESTKRTVKNNKWMGLITITYIDSSKNTEYMKRCDFLSKNNINASQFTFSKKIKDSFRNRIKERSPQTNSIKPNKTVNQD